ncbi:unnamed protein product [Phytophthora fragariaefolia]|uniref:Unnamed protein product n=1 Tax=Phytophthora fragariaefolia TaxID=1490495 RepID=A0A9W6YBV6_9STRA|nr:unnamed protein product [Phytophthora fragariaefolia]
MDFARFAAELGPSAAEMGPREDEQGTQKDPEGEEWGWEEDTREEKKLPAAGRVHVQVLHLPLNVVPLLSSKTPTPEPSVFVLAQPMCAAAFPLLLHQVEAAGTPASPTGRAGADAVRKYTHVKDVLPEHIPSDFRRSMRLLAYTLAEMMLGSRLDVRERIFAVGATSLKIGHTLLKTLNEMQEDAGAQSMQGQQAATMVIIDRYAGRAVWRGSGLH